MKKAIATTSLCAITFGITYGQDVITKGSGETIQAKVLEITPETVVYKKYNNQGGPTYTVNKEELVSITYQNGSTDSFKNNYVVLNEELLKISRKTPSLLTEKGNSVFIEIPDEASRAGEAYFIEALKEWGYWNVVSSAEEAHFIIEFNIDKKVMLDKSASVTLKTREGNEFKKSKPFRASTNAFNGYNAFKGAANKVVEKYLMKEFS